MAPDRIDPQSRSCLLVVACEGGKAEAVALAVRDAETRVMASELLGDFMELRFIPLPSCARSRQATPDERAAAVARLADALTAPVPGPAQVFLALAVIHPSAAAAHQLITDCAGNRVIAALPLSARIFAATDDRGPAAGEPRTGQSAAPAAEPSVVAGTTTLIGRWTRQMLATGLKEYCQWLLDEWAAAGQPGISQQALALLRSQAVDQMRSLEEPDLLAEDGPEADLLAGQPLAALAAEGAAGLPPPRARRRWSPRGLATRFTGTVTGPGPPDAFNRKTP